jgi:hypothetical protein
LWSFVSLSFLGNLMPINFHEIPLCVHLCRICVLFPLIKCKHVSNEPEKSLFSREQFVASRLPRICRNY